MRWIKNYQLFLFDFDGLLVNTEEYHYQAYKKMMKDRGVPLKWDFPRYCLSAHYATEKFRKDLFIDHPDLATQDPTFENLYREKQAAMQLLLSQKTPDLMEGVNDLLEVLQSSKISHCVVTHSPQIFIEEVRKAHPILNKIPYWITRNDYTHPKPNPECYQMAIERYSKQGDRVIGFEDSPRGLTALLGTSAKAVLVTQVPYVEIPDFLSKNVSVYTSFKEIDLDT